MNLFLLTAANTDGVDCNTEDFVAVYNYVPFIYIYIYKVHSIFKYCFFSPLILKDLSDLSETLDNLR